MKKYNLRNIMKRAWQLVKGMAMSLSSSLKQAWREAKMDKEIKMAGTEKQVKWANDIIRNAKEKLSAMTEKFDKETRKLAESFWKGDDEAKERAFADIEKRSAIAADVYIRAMVAVAEKKRSRLHYRKKVWNPERQNLRKRSQICNDRM